MMCFDSSSYKKQSMSKSDCGSGDEENGGVEIE
jgi:hypothetical protein